MENKDIKINFLQVCENAFFDDIGRLSMICIFDTLQTDALPVTHPKFSIVLNVNGKIFDKTKVLKIIDPEGKEMVNFTANLENLEDKPYSNIILNFINISFNLKGKYEIIFEVGGEHINKESKYYLNIV